MVSRKRRNWSIASFGLSAFLFTRAHTPGVRVAEGADEDILPHGLHPVVGCGLARALRRGDVWNNTRSKRAETVRGRGFQFMIDRGHLTARFVQFAGRFVEKQATHEPEDSFRAVCEGGIHIQTDIGSIVRWGFPITIRGAGTLRWMLTSRQTVSGRFAAMAASRCCSSFAYSGSYRRTMNISHRTTTGTRRN